ncbi:hypothetical protein GCM10023213_25740 [Prosthecobacter algae]|uniref:Uncharacterized protein n=1 Tax=Prosthecobacter algae TaxID=1144682 RepID=A0ABP9P691_9BACT
MNPRRFLKLFSLAVTLTASFSPLNAFSAAVELSPAQLQRVGQRIWQNECAGTVAGLTSWNSGEDFASLGIGHFIWYPAGKKGPFEESFPPLATFLQSRGVEMPDWTTGPCPWTSKANFEADKDGPRQTALRAILVKTVSLQTEFIIARLQRALPKMKASSKKPALVQAHFDALLASPEGAFCLIDYVNFKGEGTAPTERYNGQGWGLLQVLEGMKQPTPAAFAEASKTVLSRRVQNAPAARKEQRWLAGWHNRCDGYKRKL